MLSFRQTRRWRDWVRKYASQFDDQGALVQDHRARFVLPVPELIYAQRAPARQDVVMVDSNEFVASFSGAEDWNLVSVPNAIVGTAPTEGHQYLERVEMVIPDNAFDPALNWFKEVSSVPPFGVSWTYEDAAGGQRTVARVAYSGGSWPIVGLENGISVVHTVAEGVYRAPGDSTAYTAEFAVPSQVSPLPYPIQAHFYWRTSPTIPLE